MYSLIPAEHQLQLVHYSRHDTLRNLQNVWINHNRHRIPLQAEQYKSEVYGLFRG